MERVQVGARRESGEVATSRPAAWRGLCALVVLLAWGGGAQADDLYDITVDDYDYVEAATTLTGPLGCFNVIMEARYTGSISFPNLTTLDEGDCSAASIRSISGGVLDAPGLTTTIGNIQLTASGVSTAAVPAVLNIDSLASLSPGGKLGVYNGAIVNSPLLTTIDDANLVVSGATSTIDHTQISNFDASDVTAVSGAQVAFPLVTSFSGAPGFSVEVLKAQSAGSVLDLSNITSMDADGSGVITLQALSGGLLDLSNLLGVTGQVLYQTGAPSSLLDISKIDTLEPGHRIVAAGGDIVAAPLTRFDNASLKLIGTEAFVDLTQVTDIDQSDLAVQSGALIYFPLLTSYTTVSGCGYNTWSGHNTGSLLDLSTLTVLTTPDETCGGLIVQMLSGSDADLSGLTDGNSGRLTLTASGSGSGIDASGLTALPLSSSATVRDGGEIVFAPLTAIDEGSLVIDGPTSKLDTSQIASMNHANVSIQGGAQIAFPSAKQLVRPDSCYTKTLEADEADSLLDLSTITDIVGGTCGSTWFAATKGGRVDLTGVETMTQDLTFQVWDADSDIQTTSVTLDSAGTILGRNEGQLTLSGSLSYAMTLTSSFDWRTGSILRMTGDPNEVWCPTLEVAGKDLGGGASSFEDNFDLQVLKIGPNARVQLVDMFDNGNRGPSGESEALYVDVIELGDSKSRLHIDGINVYYNSLVGGSSDQLRTGEVCTPRGPHSIPALGPWSGVLLPAFLVAAVSILGLRSTRTRVTR